MSWYHDLLSPITAWGKSCEAEADKRATICQAEAEHELLVLRSKTAHEGVKFAKTLSKLTDAERKTIAKATKPEFDWS